MCVSVCPLVLGAARGRGGHGMSRGVPLPAQTPGFLVDGGPTLRGCNRVPRDRVLLMSPTGVGWEGRRGGGLIPPFPPWLLSFLQPAIPPASPPPSLLRPSPLLWSSLCPSLSSGPPSPPSPLLPSLLPSLLPLLPSLFFPILGSSRGPGSAQCPHALLRGFPVCGDTSGLVQTAALPHPIWLPAVGWVPSPLLLMWQPARLRVPVSPVPRPPRG